MTSPSSPLIGSSSSQRPVLFWRPDADESHVQANVERAAEYLSVSTEAVVAAIESGELLGGWFVDWEVSAG